MKSTVFTIVASLMLASFIPCLEVVEISEDKTTSFTASTSDPIRNEPTSEIPAEVETYDLGLWTEWYHHVDDWPIDDQEAITYYFYIDNSLLGS